MCDQHAISLTRRRLLATGLAGAFVGGLALPAAAQQSETPPAQNTISPDEALKRLLEGNARYASNSSQNRDYSAGREARSSAQYPIAGLVSCADARVAPELAFDQGPGDLFVVRVAGNFVNDDGLASLEYGVKFLGMPLIVVLGHSNCGAVAATIKVLKDKVALPGHLPQLVGAIKPAIDRAEKAKASDALAEATLQNIRYNVRKLEKAGPIIADFVAKGKVKVVGGLYDIATGRVSLV
ncbi:carbonic anhydrase [Labrys okinawensis]|uniref:Carbonic anhydrase n=1 Tax=Labrys okinawensis TaxID=346911 RepID=A0A2S9QI73_9HYPH|nr:carbonic anhydrase [Labrys okinawensis]PRH89022.1 carbonic anhydrase [Labrys okinawensis]